MYSSVKFLVPSVIVPPLLAGVVPVPDEDELVGAAAADDVVAGAEADDELELPEPHAATASAATSASTSPATVRGR